MARGSSPTIASKRSRLVFGAVVAVAIAVVVSGCISLPDLSGAASGDNQSGGAGGQGGPLVLPPASFLDWSEPTQWIPFVLFTVAIAVNRYWDRRDRRKFHGKDA